jgi:hypothetical protein
MEDQSPHSHHRQVNIDLSILKGFAPKPSPQGTLGFFVFLPIDF